LIQVQISCQTVRAQKSRILRFPLFLGVLEVQFLQWASQSADLPERLVSGRFFPFD
jgi:hypothetical protein